MSNTFIEKKYKNWKNKFLFQMFDSFFLQIYDGLHFVNEICQNKLAQMNVTTMISVKFIFHTNLL